MSLEDLKLNDETSGDLGGYFHVTITDLDLGTAYPLQFQYIYADKRQNDNWSAVKVFTTAYATVPDEPELQVTDVVGGARFIKVTWSGKNGLGAANLSNFDRVDVHISGTSFGDGTKPAGSFKASGTQTFACVPGTYIVQLKTISLNGQESIYSQGYTITVTDTAEAIDSPVAPSSSGFSSRRILGGLEVSWDGTYSSSWSGFSAINIYAGTSSSATSGTYIKVGQMTANKITNKIVVPVDETYVRYGQPVYIHASSVNKSDVESSIVANVTSQSSGAARATDSDINDGAVTFAKLAANTLTVDNLSAGTINSTSYIRAGTSGSARVEMASANISGGPSAGFYIYNSGGTAVLSAPLSGGLSITGALSATSISTSSGKFTVTSGGVLQATDASISGTITASGGFIGSIIISGGGMQNSGGTWDLASNGTIRLGSSPYIYLSPSLGIYDTAGKFNLSLSGTSTIGGWTIGSTTLSAGNVTLNSNGTLQVGSKFSVASDGKLTASGADISGTITANALDTTSLDIASDGAITTTSGNFGVTALGVLSATGASISGSLTTTGSPGGYANNTLTVSGGKLSADKVIYLQTDISTGIIDVLGSRIYLEAPTEVTGSFLASGSATFGTFGSQFEFLSTSGNVRVAATYSTTASSRAMYVSTSGLYGTLSSTIRRKHQISDYLINEDSLLSLTLKTFKFKEEYDEDQAQQYGFIAEEAEELGLAELIQYDSEGLVDYFDYARLPVFLLQVAKTQRNKILNLESRLDALEA